MRDRGQRSTPVRLALWTAASAAALAALLAATAGSFAATDGGVDSVAQHATVASDAADLYFSLSDLDAEAARLVLLGNGANPATGSLDHAGDQIATLTAYNERTADADADLRRLAATAGAADADRIAALTSGVTEYHQIADAAIALDQTAPSTFPDTTGAPAGQPAAGAIGYYARAATLMQSTLLPEASALRESKAGALSDAASSAHLAGIVGAVAAGVVGLVTVIITLQLHRRLRMWFRRTTNLGVLTAALIVLALTLSSLITLLAAASDASAAGNRFTDYLAVTRTRSASYDADGAVTRYLLMPDTTQTALHQAQTLTQRDLATLGSAGSQASARWKTITSGDIPAITGPIAAGTAPDNVPTALARDTGTARGQEAFDFFFYDSALTSLSQARIADFDAAMSSARSDLSGWSWLPWVLAVAALAGLGVGVRPRLAEYR